MPRASSPDFLSAPPGRGAHLRPIIAQAVWRFNGQSARRSGDQNANYCKKSPIGVTKLRKCVACHYKNIDLSLDFTIMSIDFFNINGIIRVKM